MGGSSKVCISLNFERETTTKKNKQATFLYTSWWLQRKHTSPFKHDSPTTLHHHQHPSASEPKHRECTPRRGLHRATHLPRDLGDSQRLGADGEMGNTLSTTWCMKNGNLEESRWRFLSWKVPKIGANSSHFIQLRSYVTTSFPLKWCMKSWTKFSNLFALCIGSPTLIVHNWLRGQETGCFPNHPHHQRGKSSLWQKKLPTN